VLAGFFIAMVTSLTLTALGVALSLTLGHYVAAEHIKIFVGVWVAVSLLASLFLGGMIISRLTVGESDIVEPTIYGVLLWALVFFVLPLLPVTNANVGFGVLLAAQETPGPGVSLSEEELTEAGLSTEQVGAISKMSQQAARASAWVNDNAMEVAWLSFVALIVSLAASVGGSLLGATFSEDHLVTARKT
jgi:hypothetical protein